MIKSSYKESHKIDDEKLQASSYAIDIGAEFQKWKSDYETEYDISQYNLKYYQ